MQKPIDTAIFPVAGLGTRMLPATKAVPKELLPVYDRPLIQLAVDEAVAAGIKRMIFVNHPSKAIIERHFEPDEELSETLRADGKAALAQKLDATVPDDEIRFHFVTQNEPLGLGHAILCARDLAGEGPVAVILPDDVLLGAGSAIGDMMESYDPEFALHMVASMPVPASDVSKYGIIDPLGHVQDRQVAVRAMLEKPSPDAAPSNLAIIGRYILGPGIFDSLAETEPGAGGEIQLTDAIASVIATKGVSAFRLSQDRYDCGNPDGLLAASLARRAQLQRESEAAA